MEIMNKMEINKLIEYGDNVIFERLKRHTIHGDDHENLYGMNNDNINLFHGAENDDDNNTTIAKGTAMICLFVAAMLFGLAPYKLLKCFGQQNWSNTATDTNVNSIINTRDRRSAMIVTILLAFGGGVLLSTTFLHLLPEVGENLSELQEDHLLPSHMPFHLAELLMCLGFFLMYMLEEFVHIYLHRHHRSSVSNCDPDNSDDVQNQKIEKQDHQEQATTVEAGPEEMAFQRAHSIRNSVLMKKRPSVNQSMCHNYCDQRDQNQQELYTNNSDQSKNTKNELTKVRTISNDNGTNQSNDDLFSITRQLDDHHHSHLHLNHHHHHHIPPPSLNKINNGVTTSNSDDLIVSSVRGLLIVLALSIHELFEGLAVGLERSTANVWYMFAAVAAHKLVLAFCVGLELIVVGTRRRLAILYICTFAGVSPIGIGIGILISDGQSNGTRLMAAILQGLACGTLLYVIFFEILEKCRRGLIQLTAVFFGFAVMFGLQFIAGHEHSHSHDGGSHHHDHEEHDRLLTGAVSVTLDHSN